MPTHERLCIWLPGYTREQAQALADALAQVAAEYGYVIPRGPGAGKRGNRREFIEAIVGGEVVVTPLDPMVAFDVEQYLRWASSVVESHRVAEGLEALADAVRDARRRHAQALADEVEEYGS